MSFFGRLYSSTSLSGRIYYSAGLVAPWTPEQLFTQNEVGAWYDPSDLTTLYQDTAGTTPVTTPGQRVALMLDKSRGLTLGAELVTNGDFNSATSWVLGAKSAISEGVATITAASAGEGSVIQTINVTAGRSYKITFTVSNYSAGDLAVVGDNVNIAPNVTANGTYSRIFTAASTTSVVGFRRNGGVLTVTVDDFSVRELPGAHATQSVLAQRPTYAVEPVTGRRNLLTYSEDVSNAIWSTFQSVKVDASTFRADSGGGTGFVFIGQSITTGGAVSHVISAEFKYTNNRWVWLQAAAIGSLNTQSWFDIQNGVLGTKGPDAVSHSIENLGGGWYRCSLRFVGDAVDTSGQLRVALSGTDNNLSDAPRDGVASVQVRNIQFEIGSTATAYQRVVTAQDVSEAGIAPRPYLFFDGIDDGMVTPTITPGVDKAQVFAGVRKLSDAAIGTVVELSASYNSNAGSFTIFAPITTSGDYRIQFRGTITKSMSTPANYPAPITNILSGTGDIAASNQILRVNGIQVAQNTETIGTGNFEAYPLYIGRRGGTTLPFSGHIYGLIVRFSSANLGASQIAAAERWLAQRTGVTL